MAIIEKRQLFRLDDKLRISYLRLSDEEVNDAIHQLSMSAQAKDLFPKIDLSQEILNINITVFGLSFPCKESLIEDTHVSLAIQLETEGNPIYAVGKIVYCKYDTEKSNYKAGVRFKFMAKEDMQILEEYLVEKLQKGLNKHVKAHPGPEDEWSDESKDSSDRKH